MSNILSVTIYIQKILIGCVKRMRVVKKYWTSDVQYYVGREGEKTNMVGVRKMMCYSASCLLAGRRTQPSGESREIFVWPSFANATGG